MTIIAGATLRIWFVNVQFRDPGSAKKNKGGELAVVEFGQDAVNALAFAQMLQRSKYKQITFVWTWTLA